MRKPITKTEVAIKGFVIPQTKPKRKLTEDQVREIRSKKMTEERRLKLAAKYGVSVNTIGQVFRGQTYREVV